MGNPPAEVGKPIDADDEPLAHQMLHGGGTALNSGNRWFDKTMQVGVKSINQSFKYTLMFIIS